MATVTNTIPVKHAPIARLGEFLAGHPNVEVLSGDCHSALEFVQSGRTRRVWFGRPDVELSGLAEVMDNNPLVCADDMSVPSPEGTLALIALAPLIRAGALGKRPALSFNFDANLASVRTFLSTEGFKGEVGLEKQEPSRGTVLSCTVRFTLAGTLEPNELEGLFAEWYGKAFYVRAQSGSELDLNLVKGKPFALYQIAKTNQGEQKQVRVIADKDGKCGAAQIIHAMNVMAGFEESLGIPDAF